MKLLSKLLLIAAIAVAAYSQTASAAGTVGGVFLIVGTSARCEAMGGACVASVKDASAVNINPAAIVEQPGQQATFMHNETLLDLSQEYISYTSTMGKKGMGASLVYMDMGSQAAYSTTNVSLGNFRPTSYAMTLAYSIKANKEISYGAGIKYVKEKIASESGTAFAVDAGILYQPYEAPWSAAVVVQNFGTKIKVGSSSDPLPLTLRVGGAYTMPKTPLTLTSDAYFIKNNSPEYHVGAEYMVNDYIGLRAGYNSADDLDNGFTFGLGVTQDKFGLDYAFIPMGVFGDSHRFSFSAKF